MTAEQLALATKFLSKPGFKNIGSLSIPIPGGKSTQAIKIYFADESYVFISPGGTRNYYNSFKEAHRDDDENGNNLPAVVYPSGHVEYWKNGKQFNHAHVCDLEPDITTL